MYIYATNVVFGKAYDHLFLFMSRVNVYNYYPQLLGITRVADVFVVIVDGCFARKRREKQYNILHICGGQEDTWDLKTRSLTLYVHQNTGSVVTHGK